MAKTYKQIIDAMKAYIVANQTTLTDLNEGSVIASMLEAAAREMAAEYIAIITNVDAYQKKIAFAQFDFQRKEGLAASGSVVFGRDIAYRNDISIPAGTKVTTADGVSFLTTAGLVLAAGSSNSAAVGVLCETVGILGNVAAATITVIESTIPGLATVSNSAACAGGVNQETEDEYDSRFREFILGLGKSSVHGIRAAVLAVNGIKSCSVVEHFPAESGYNFTVYAENGAGALPVALLTKIENVVIGGGEEDGCKAAGVRARVLAPTVQMLTITITATIDWSIPRMYVEQEMSSKISSYISGLGIGEAPEIKTLEDIAKGQYGILSVASVVIDGLPAPFLSSMIARLASVVAEFA
ncbi:MAG: hypothetical protein SAMD01599839_07740 [Rectinema sp.]